MPEKRPIPKIVAHRGASAYAPENTLAAFRKAIAMGADFFELDCALSRDGEVVVIHDATLERTTNGAGAVREHTLEELRKLGAGSWKGPEFAGETIPTLGEALALVGDTVGVYVEIKNIEDDRPLLDQVYKEFKFEHAPEPVKCRDYVMQSAPSACPGDFALTRAVLECIRERNVVARTVIQSFSAVVGCMAQSLAPEIRFELLGFEEDGAPQTWRNCLRALSWFGAAGFNVNKEAINEERVAVLHRAGKDVGVYVVNEPEEMGRFAAWGVDTLITDKPGLCRQTLTQTQSS